MKKCLVIGAAMLDIVMEIGSLPKSGDDVYASSQEMSVGGCAYNVADILKHFQLPYTLLAPVGNGPYGKIISEKLASAGHVSSLSEIDGDNGYCLCLVESSGERTFITLPGVECSYKKEWLDSVDGSLYDMVYICGYELESSSAIIDFCVAHPHLEVYYAPSPRIMDMDMTIHERVFSLDPIIHLNESEALSFTACNNVKDAAGKLFGMTGNLVIVTLGAKGCYYCNDGDCGYIDGTPSSVVDTIGAGDSHVGAFIAGAIQGLSTVDALCQAGKVSAKIVAQKGATMSEMEFASIEF